MIPNIRSPKVGEPIPVKWGQDVARAIKALADQSIQYPMSRDDEPSPPWRVSASGGDTITVGSGFIIGYFAVYTAASPNTPPASDGTYPPTRIIKAPISKYAGGSLTAAAGVQYVYAKTSRGRAAAEYSETSFTGTDQSLIEMFDDFGERTWTTGEPTDSVTMELSASDPDSTTILTAVCIAKISTTDSITTVLEQYTWDNPTLFMPYANFNEI